LLNKTITELTLHNSNFYYSTLTAKCDHSLMIRPTRYSARFQFVDTESVPEQLTSALPKLSGCRSFYV